MIAFKGININQCFKIGHNLGMWWMGITTSFFTAMRPPTFLLYQMVIRFNRENELITDAQGIYCNSRAGRIFSEHRLQCTHVFKDNIVFIYNTTAILVHLHAHIRKVHVVRVYVCAWNETWNGLTNHSQGNLR